MSKIVPLEGFGGGSSSPLNFKIVAYATEEELAAAQPAENTIGVVTTNTITSWIFDAIEPTDPIEGIVWFTIDTSSTVAFNAIKKNSIQVYPLSAKQYIGGAWAGKVAKSYLGGAWADWVTYLYNKGNEYTDLTGGFSSVKATTQDGYTKGTMTKNSESIKLSCSSATVVGAVTVNKIPIKGRTTIKVNVLSVSGDGAASLRVSNDNVLYGNNVATQDFSEPGIVSLAVETLDGEYYVGVRCVAGSGKTQTVEFDMLEMK